MTRRTAPRSRPARTPPPAPGPPPSEGSDPARELVLGVLGDVLYEGRHLAAALDRALPSLPAREARAFATDVCYGTMRHRRALETLLAPHLEAPERLPQRLRTVLLTGAYERAVRGTPAHAAVHAWVERVKRGPVRERGLAGLVNAVLRRVDPAALPRPLGQASLPPWLFERFEALLGADAERAASAMLEREPLWLTAADPERAAAALAADGAEVAAGPLAGSLRVRSPLPLAQLRAYRDGLVQPQNPSSWAVVHACGEVAGRRVLDLCSGNGVKAVALAARGAAVTSVERDPAKLQAAARNAERLGVAHEGVVWDLTTTPALPAAPVVLLDAPCSGTGTLRGHPEITLRVDPEAVRGLAALQARLLASAAPLVAPGGRLVYAVCALTPEEGPAQVARFLATHADFTPTPSALAGLPLRQAGAGAVILPTDALDGFFVAVLERRDDGTDR